MLGMLEADADSESETEEEAQKQKEMVADLRQFFLDNKLELKPRDQIVLHEIPDKPSTHRSLRLAVSNFLKDLPDEVKNNTVDIIFNGKRRGLADLAYRQRKLGQLVDDNGVMVMATSLYMGRDIDVYSAREDGRGCSVTKIDGGEGAGDKEPLTIYYFDDCQHYQSICRSK